MKCLATKNNDGSLKLVPLERLPELEEGELCTIELEIGKLAAPAAPEAPAPAKKHHRR